MARLAQDPQWQGLEARHPRGGRPQRVPARVETLRLHDLATMERLSPPKPRRNQDALCEPKVRVAKLLGQRLMAHNFDRQGTDSQVRVTVLNGLTAHGIQVTKDVG